MTGLTYRVVWLYTVRPVWLGNLLLELSARGESSDPVFEALDRVTAKLATHPDARGESRADGRRLLHVAPVTITYEVHPDERLVIVVHAHYVRRPGAPPP